MAAVQAFTPLADIKPFKTNWKIQVKIVHSWTQYTQFTGETVEMVLADTSGTLIHATVKKPQVSKLQRFIVSGEWRIIEHFTLTKSTGKYRATKHGFKMSMMEKTVISRCPAISDDIYVDLANFPDILNEAGLSENILIDVLGQVVCFNEMKLHDVNNKITKKLECELRDRPNNMTENFQNRNQLPGLSYEFKFLVLGRPKGNTFMIGARGLSITWSEDSNYWTWLTLPNQNPYESVVEIAYLRKASWLDVEGKFDTRYLSPSTRYEVVFVVLLQYTKFKWKKPVKLKLVLPNSREQPQERRMSMAGHITNQWIDIPVGEFTTSVTNIGEISFAMYEHECQLWKSGLFVKGVTIRPKY